MPNGWSNCCGRHNWENDTRINDVQAQRQNQDQAQEAEQEQQSRTILREIGKVHISNDNYGIAIGILVLLGFLGGTLDPAAIRETLERLLSARPV
jgi:hypothetical protein